MTPSAGYVRGRLTRINAKGVQVFEDTGKPVPAAGGEERPCPWCGALATEETSGVDRTWGKADPCLGVLPGVASACCGHGQHEGWIRFAEGLEITLAVRVDYPGAYRP